MIGKNRRPNSEKENWKIENEINNSLECNPKKQENEKFERVLPWGESEKAQYVSEQIFRRR